MCDSPTARRVLASLPSAPVTHRMADIDAFFHGAAALAPEAQRPNVLAHVPPAYRAGLGSADPPATAPQTSASKG